MAKMEQCGRCLGVHHEAPIRDVEMLWVIDPDGRAVETRATFNMCDPCARGTEATNDDLRAQGFFTT